jgi:hypothetical protein
MYLLAVDMESQTSARELHQREGSDGNQRSIYGIEPVAEANRVSYLGIC